MNDDRFQGEAAEPPVVCRCDYCGDAIRQGSEQYIYEGKNICIKCAGRFAWHEFEALSKKHIAGPDNWL